MNYLKKLAIFFMFISLMSAKIVFAAPTPPVIKAKSAILIDGITGKVLYSKNAEEKRYPASTTKIMSLIVALEHGNLDDIITASSHAANTEGSSLWLTEGEQLKLIDLLYGIMLISGNDATVAVAEHISGSVEKFAQLMTEKAQAIGAKDTHFTNSSGLPDPNHVTTAHDLARITAYGYKNPLFSEIVSTKHKVIPWAGKEFGRDLYNEDRMLWLYEGGNGVKTGYTDLAGRCLVSGAKRNNIQLIAVVLDSDTMWDDSIALLDFGFSQVKSENIVKQDDILKTIRVANGKSEVVKLVASSDLVVPLFEEDKDEFSTVIDAPNKVEAPVIKGQKLGVVRVLYQNKEIATVDLQADENSERKSFFHILADSIMGFLRGFTVKQQSV
ncbi:D-alanyl-D-alanine carboxypeptidase family protein [Pelosinus sp. sgz500959]|uniref:D-alanyl-D-alanine carboxypeptidase family protein n=1 Tax=Pelosinus sp. sgz500959 TaxID=3242472 RepID=UPI00366EE039